MNHLETIYEDPSQAGSFGGVESLYAEAKKERFTYLKNEVKEWLSKRQSYTLHKPARKRLRRNKTIVFYKDKLAGIPISKSVKKRARTAGKKMVLNAISNSTRTTPTLKRHKRRRPSQAKRIRSSDVFGTL